MSLLVVHGVRYFARDGKLFHQDWGREPEPVGMFADAQEAQRFEEWIHSIVCEMDALEEGEDE